ncbi:glycoside hydrolase family 127 protein [bacterium]|nr:glycoside hydrolase family 127 protein [bacterium]
MATPILDTSHSPHVRLHTVPLPAVRLADDAFWTPLRRGNVENGLPRLHGLLEENGHMDNFRRLAGKDVARRGPLFTDSDLYKWIEAAGYVLQTEDHPDLRSLLEADIADIAAAQGDDGYLSTYFIEERAGERYQHLEYSHEMYCAGHLMQGAVAVARATGDDTLLQVACRFADHLDSVFGPGRNGTTDGHPEVELALIELYRHTRERRYLDLAAFLLSRPQSHANLPPIAQRESLIGHAVRSSYICCGGADLVMETGDPEMMANLQRLWQDLVGGKIYVTGGVGARYEGEAFGEPYELPNARAYAETCAQIGHFMWAFRMLLLTGEGQYAEAMEWILYNGLRSGVDLDGYQYFYMNPLAHDGKESVSATGHRVPPTQRSTWHGCTCCPPNVQRLLASLPGYFVTVAEREVHVHLYDALEAAVDVPGVGPVRLKIETRYPWDGGITITVGLDEAADFALHLRIPTWADGAAAFVGGAQPLAGEPGTYLVIQRQWQPGDVVQLDLPMALEALEAHPNVTEDRGAVALKRGPIVYCVESVDHRTPVAELSVSVTPGEGLPASWEAVWREDLLGGVVVIEGPGFGCVPTERPLYAAVAQGYKTGQVPAHITAIPYYAWANRGPAAMRVWVASKADREVT